MAPSHFADIEEIPSTADCGPVSAVVHRYTVLVGSAVGFRAHPVCVHDVPAWGPPLILPLLGRVITPRPPRSPCTWNKHAGATFNIITCSLKDLYLRFEFNFNRERERQRDRRTQRERERWHHSYPGCSRRNTFSGRASGFLQSFQFPVSNHQWRNSLTVQETAHITTRMSPMEITPKQQKRP